MAKATVKELELHDEWMAECYLTISVKSATPIAFAVGDYIDYRGERYTIQYDPNVIKKATSGSYGEGFTYDNIKFVGLQDEVVRCDFNDIVLNDNDIHYSALPTFPFYCESVDDLLDRIQANLEDLYPGQWIIIGLNTVRNAQRGTAVGRAQAFLNAYKQYIDPTGAANTDPYGKQGVAETADNITCWDAMKKVHDDFDLNFIVRGRVIVVGTAGVFTANTFRYGKGNGLYELERIGESDQRIVTRLRAYGSEQNLPAHYYNTINKQVYATITSILHKFDTTGADFLLDLDFDRKYFTYRSESYPGTTEAPNYIIEMMANDVTVRGYVTKDATTGKCYVYCESVAGDDDRDEPDATKMAAFVQALTANDRLDFVEYVNKDAFGEGHYDYGTGHLPDNMAVSRLMLPGFPTMSLHAWVQAHKDDADKAWLAQAIADGFTFSNEVYRPYIDSPNKNQYGVRPGSIYFDGSDDTEDVHPTIEGMTYNGAPIDEVYAADQVEDNGVYPAGEEVKNIKITLPVLGFELDKVYEDGASIDMKNGMCGARSFKMAGTPKKDANGRWVCTVERVHDDALDLWFPYCDFQIHGSSEVGREHGDNYVLTGIDMPDAYIAAASVKLLQVSIEALKKNHAPRYTYQPRIDELWMQRQHDTAISSQGVVSLHDTLKAGDIFAFADTDLNIDANVIIDVLTIRENGNNGIPTYEVTLRDEKQVGTIQKITNKVDSIISGATQVNGATGGGLTVRQVQSLIDRFGGEQFLSKLNDDTAEGYIKMLKGLQVGNNFASGILGEGGVLRKRTEDGKVELEVDILYARMKAYFDTVEVREYQHTGGNRIASVAGNRICRVEWYDANNQVLEQTSANLSSVAYFRCYFRATDGEDTVKNNWVVGDMAYCHVTSIANSSDNPEQKGLNQKHLWRLVIGRNTEGTLTEDGEAYIDLSNRSTETISSESYAGYQSGSDTPAAQDDIIQLGNVNDTTRQGAIVEFVTGTDAPSYQIYQGIGQKVGSDASSIYSLTSKNQITIGYNTATGKADMKVYGDAYIGARDRSTFIEYKQDDGTQQHAPILNIKAKIQTLPNSTYEGMDAEHFVQANQIKYDQAIQNLTNVTNDLQSQIDGEIVSWFYEGTPTLSNAPAVDWNTDVLKERHLGDMYYDVGTGLTSGFAYRFIKTADEVEEGEPQTYTYSWQYIDDTAITLALAKAAEALGLAATKAKTFTTASNTLPSPPYKTGDLWLNATGTWGSGDTAVTLNGDILKVKANINRASGDTPLISDWELAGNYMNEQDFLDWKAGQYAQDLTNASNAYQNDAVANAIKKALGSALGATTLQDGGLMLTSLIYLRKLNEGGDPTQVSDYTTWAGISGEYNQNDETVSGGAKGHGIAAWYGGDMVDKQMLSDADIDAGWGVTLPDESTNYRWARSLFRFDGSGYIADANIYWDKVGSMTIKNLQTIYGTQQGVSVDINTLSSLTSIFNTETKAGTGFTELLVQPQNAFSRLYLNRGAAVASYPSDGSINDYAVLNFGEMKSRFITKDWFNKFFKVHYKNNGTDAVLDPNNDFPAEATDKNIEAIFSFWTNYAISALGQGVDGSHAIGSLGDLSDVELTSPAADQILKFDGTHWVNAAAPQTYVLPTATTSALGGIKVSNALSSQVTLTSGAGTTANRYYGVQIDSVGQAFVNIPWENTTYTLAGLMGSTAIGGATQPIYWNGSAFANTTYTLGKSVPSDALFTDTNTWRNILLSGTEKLGNGTGTKGLNFVGDGKTTITFLAAGTGEGQSGNANYATLKISSTWRGIQDNLTSDSSTDSLSAKQGKALKGSISTLEGYFTNGVANTAAKLSTTSKTAWGRTFWTAGGVPDSISGALESVTNITMSGYIKIGSVYIGEDSNGDLEIYKLSNGSHVAANLYARGGVSALGQSSSGGGGGQGDVTWELLVQSDTRQINISHLAGDANYAGVLSVLTGYTTSGKNYKVQEDSNHHLYVNVPWTDNNTTYTNGTGLALSSNTFSINSTYQTYISHGESAYNSLSSYLPLSGGTMTGRIYTASNMYDRIDGSGGGVGALHLNNSDITGVNAIITGDLSDSWKESLAFVRTNGNYDTFRAADGTFYFGVNNGTEYTAIHSGNISSQSVNYAASAGSVAWGNVTSKPNVVTTDTTQTISGAKTFSDIRVSNIPSDTSMPYFLGIEAFADGGRIKWVGKDDAKVGYATSAGSAGYAPNVSQTTITSLSTFVHNSDFIYAAAGGENSVTDKPTNVDAFGVFSYKTADGWYGQILTSSDQAQGLYWRTGTSLSGGWRTILDSSNYTSYTVTKTGSGASGTWNINVSGSAYSLSSWAQSSGNEDRYVWHSQSSNNALVAYNSALTFNPNAGVLKIADSSSSTHIGKGYIKIGSAYLSYDSNNNALCISANANGTGAMNLYAVGGVSALGSSGSGGGGGGQGDVTWDLLKQTADTGRWIDISYISSALNTFGQNYLPLSGGTLSNANFGGALTIERSGSANAPAIGFKNSYGILGYLTIFTKNGTFVRYNSEVSAYYAIIDSSNYSSYAVPLSGGGTISNSNYGTQLCINRSGSSGNAVIRFTNDTDGHLGYIGVTGSLDSKGKGQLRFSNHSGADWDVLHTGNYTDYTVTKTGSGASGTWGINITGNADTLDSYHSRYFVPRFTEYLETGYWYIPAVGSVITSQQANDGWVKGRIQVKAGDSFYIKGRGGVDPDLYAFTDNNHRVLSVSGDSVAWESSFHEITASADGYLYFDFNKSYSYGLIPNNWLAGFITAANIGNQSVYYATSAGSAYTVSSFTQVSGSPARYVWMSHSTNNGNAGYSPYLTFNPETATLSTYNLSASNNIIASNYISATDYVRAGTNLIAANNVIVGDNYGVLWDSGSYWQRIINNDTSDTSNWIFKFQQSEGTTGSSWVDYFTIYKSSAYIGSNAIIHAGNIGSQSVNYANYAGYTPRVSQSSISSLSTFTHSSDLIYTAAGGSNSVTDKPSGVDAFGVFSYKTADGWYGQLLTSANQAAGLYWRTASSSLSGGWKKVLDSTNYTDYTVTKSGSGASGTWSINVTGSAATLSSWAQASGNTKRYVWFSQSENDARVAYSSNIQFIPNTGVLYCGGVDTTGNSTIGGVLYTHSLVNYGNAQAQSIVTRGLDGSNGTGSYGELYLNYNTASNIIMCYNGGDVGIGWSPSYKLDISGSLRNSTSAYLATSSGNVGIGTTSASYKLHVNGESYFENWMFVNSSVTALGIELQPSSSSAGHGGHIDFHFNKSSADYTTRLIEDASGQLKLIGDFYATGGVTALVATSSDIRKKNVVSYDLPLTLNQIADAPTIKFIWKDKEKLGEQVGSIAQYWQKVLPQTIRVEKDKTLSLQYGVAALVSSIITARKVVDHEREIERLKKRVDDLEEENRLLKLKIA